MQNEETIFFPRYYNQRLPPSYKKALHIMYRIYGLNEFKPIFCARLTYMCIHILWCIPSNKKLSLL